MNSLWEQSALLAPLVLGALSIRMLLPREGQRPWIIGTLCGLAALLWFGKGFLPPAGDAVQDGLFYVFAAGAVLSGVMLITDRNPVYAALWFALATLSVCGLFLLNAAPFLAATTVIVYAGAIVVTFVFVIMLAQQAGAAGYDRRASQPMLATISAFLLLGCLLYTLQEWGADESQRPQFVLAPASAAANSLSQPLPRPEPGLNDLGTLQGVGRSLFGDYLYMVELAGTVLLIATIGTIALAPRRSQGTL